MKEVKQYFKACAQSRVLSAMIPYNYEACSCLIQCYWVILRDFVAVLSRNL